MEKHLKVIEVYKNKCMKKTKYFNKKYYDANCAVIHYNDNETKLYKEKQAFKKKLKNEIYSNYYDNS